VSGNTVEALQMAKSSVERGAETICISSGGLLKEFSASHGAKHITIPNLLVPRASLPYLLVPGIQLIDSLLLKSAKKDLASLSDLLAETRRKVSIEVPEEFNIAKRVSTFLRSGLATCFSSPSLYPAAKRLKNSVNENAKSYCFRESVLEGSHNGIVPFTYNYETDCKPVLLQWANDEKIVRDRFETLKHLFGEIGQSAIEVNATDDSLVLAIVNSIYILDYSTIYLALSKKIDPSPTPAIDILKKLESS
jgi:glucose/mannose-6-phosphate isomerase